MASSVLQEVEAGALGILISESQANQAAITAFLASGEADVTAGLANLLKNIPSVKGVLALALGPVEAAVEAGIEAYVASLIAKYTPAELFSLYIALLQKLQSEV